MDNEFIVFPKSTIQDALIVINGNSKGAVVVVDNNQKLLRIVTDGDIRRALIDGLKLESTIEEMEVSLRTEFVIEETEPATVLGIMNTKEIDHMVYVDSLGRPTDLKHRRDISPVLLSSPHMGIEEMKYVQEAFETNWIAPLGPNVKGFEQELAKITGNKYAVALSSGTAAIHIALILLGVKTDDCVLCSSLTFVASANPILYQGAKPVFIDSELESWNMCPIALENAIISLAERGTKPKAIVLVHLYGQPAKIDEILAVAKRYGIPVIEDAAESLGANYKNRSSGSFGDFGIYSFNGNKIITTSGGGMLVTSDKLLAERAVYLSTQAREDFPFYEHTEVGFNYRMSNVLAGIGRGQIQVLKERVEARREVFENYVKGLRTVDAIMWMPEMEDTYANRWLTAFILDPNKTKLTPTQFIGLLKKSNIEARHVWKPMHLQPLFDKCEYFCKVDGESNCDYLFENGVCLPSGSNMTNSEQARVISAILDIFDKTPHSL